MADSITQCVCFEQDGSLLHRVVHYHLENGANSTEISVTVKPFEMVDPEDTDELKTIANAKAATVKAAWIASLAAMPIMEEAEPITGPVTL